MRQAVPPFAESRSDFDIFSGLADSLGVATEFTEGRSEMEWIERLYGKTRRDAAKAGVQLPDFQAFWAGEQVYFGPQVAEQSFKLERFREDPDKHPLRTPSGRIEIFSSRIDSFAYDDCSGHPRWFEKKEWAHEDEFPLHLVSNQPRTRLHSQYDHAGVSRASKRHGREVARMNPADAAARDISDGQVIRVFNGRGACLAAVQFSGDISPGVIELPTGAWFDPQDPTTEKPLEVHGNPNVLTPDHGTSRLAQGPTAHSCMVEAETFDSPLPEVSSFRPPDLA
jgi:biotin/methionine sulfoxide reductase